MSFNDGVIGFKLHGHAKIETFDAITGKKKAETEGHNFFTDYGLERFRRMSHLLIGGQFGVNYYSTEGSTFSTLEATYCNIESSLFGFMQYIFLTDNTAPLVPSDCKIPGNLTGYASRAAYTGTTLTRGNFNTTESFLLPGKLKVVFDFATDRGNGTHGSVFWSPFSNLTTYDPTNALNLLCTEKPFSMLYLVESGDGYLYGHNSASKYFYRIDAASFTILDTFEMPVSLGESAWDVLDGKAVYLESSTLHVLDLASQVVTTISSAVTNYNHGGALLNGFLYSTSANSNSAYSNVLKIDITTGQYSEYKNCGVPVYKMLRHGNSLYILSTYGDIYSYDFESNTKVLLGNIGTKLRYVGSSHTIADFLCTYYVGCFGAGADARYIPCSLTVANANANMITAKVFDTSITKNDTQTMKVTYTISIE